MDRLQVKNRKVFATVLGVVFGMVLLSFASVPLYRALCQVTGWGGITRQVVKNTSKVDDRVIAVQFNADVAPDLPWIFKPDLRQVKVRVGEDAIISYSAENRSKLPVSGLAVHNVTPLKAGKYFNKTQCFCFGEQILQPGQKVRLPVTFFIDPKIMDDPDMNDVKTITLSYTFYRHDSPALEKAIKKFYNGSTINPRGKNMPDTSIYDLKSGKPHSFHVPHASAWPLIAALAAGLMAIGAVMFMHHAEWHGFPIGAKALLLGFFGVLAVMWVWWRDVIHEAFVERAHSSAAKTGLRYGVALFIASEVMFFVAFFWAFFNSSLFPKEAIGFVWPPKGVEAVHPFGLPFLMTMILLLSGCTVTWAHHAILEGRQAESVRALLITVILGVVFTCFQGYEYYHATFHFKDGIYSSAFYMATGFHGFHVLVGSIFLTVCLFRANSGHFTSKSHFGFEAAAWYWHFVDAVWLFLFAAVYWWGNS